MDKVNTPLIKDNFYHIFNRGNNGEKIFYNERNYSFFMEKFEEYLKYYVELYSYCLLPNHFHLLVKVVREEADLTGFRNLSGLKKPKNISKSFSDFFNSYTKSINTQENRLGNLFNRPFKRKVIETNDYFLVSIVYIHRNPLHHNLTENFQTYPWSSYGDIINDRNKFVNSRKVLEQFGGMRNFVEIHHKAGFDFKEISVE